MTKKTMRIFKRRDGENDMRRINWRGGRRLLAFGLCLSLVLSYGNIEAFATNGGEDTGLCVHHPAHTQDCGYQEAVEGQECTHIHDGDCGYEEAAEGQSCAHAHDGDCGYQEAVEGHDCGHTHDEDCGYQEAVEGEECGHAHDENCGYEEGVEGSCTHTHDGDCGYQEAVEGQECTHIHDEECGYQEAVEGHDCGHTHDEECGYQEAEGGQECTHSHDENCGYQEATETGSCTFRCPICYPEHYPAMTDSGVKIIVPEEAEKNLVPTGVQTDLLQDVHLEIDESRMETDGEVSVDDFYIDVISAADEESQQPVTLEDGHCLTAEAGRSYLIVYGAYDEGGSLMAAAERTVSAAEQLLDDGEITERTPLAEARTFTAYDNGTKDGNADEGAGVEAAHTQFDATLPAGTAFYIKDADGSTRWVDPDKLILKVERYTKVTAGFNFEDHRKLINQHMNWHTGVTDSTNDAQFWRMWFATATADGEVEVEVELPASSRVTVEVRYLCPDGDTAEALQGRLGTRRTCVMDMGDPEVGVPVSFTDTDDYSLATSYEPGKIGKTDDHYTMLTYYIDADEQGNSAWGNLIALCSMKLTAGYMQSTIIKALADGSAPFDAAEENGASDESGNDSSSSNRVVRTFDSVTYTLQFVSASRSATEQLDTYVAVLEAELPLDITQARFDAKELSSIFSGDEPWQIEYKDANGDNLYIENSDGIFKCDDNGVITGTKVTINEIANGSDNTGGNAYRTDIKSQRLVAYRQVLGTGDSPAVPSEQIATVKLNVTAAANGDTIEPDFKMYVKGNRDNFTSEQDSNNNYVVSAPSRENEITTAGANTVTVSAAARYNLVIKRNADASYSGYFDFATGKESDAASGGTYGRMLSYGITLQLFNETNVVKADGTVDGAILAEKGMRGLELPVDGISFKLSLEGNAGNSGSTDDYSAILWDYALPGGSGAKTGKWGRNMFWNNTDVTTFPKGAGIYSSGDRKNAAYNSGDWNLNAVGEGVGSDGKTTAAIDGGGEEITYTFTVTGFDFDFDNFTFPSESAGNAGAMSWLAPDYIGSFSGGHIQVLQKYPKNPSTNASPEITAAVSDICAKSKGGQTVREEAKEVSDEIGGLNDNTVRMSVPVYTPGGISKHNSFARRTSKDGTVLHGSVGINFLGTSYWEGPNYDANTFAGSSIYLWGGSQLSRNSDAVMSAYNLLQKFDSKALSIDTSVDNPVRYTEVNNDSAWTAEGLHDGEKVPWSSLTGGEKENAQLTDAAGDYTILYAADPLCPDGWDSNVSVQMDRMNKATEEDLVYFRSLSELEDKGYTCIGVLLEVRNASVPAGCYPGVRIAMTVSNDPEGIGKTVATVNTARMWVKPRDAEYNIFGNPKGGDADTRITWANGYMSSMSAEEARTAYESGKRNEIRADGEDLYSEWWSKTPPNPHAEEVKDADGKPVENEDGTIKTTTVYDDQKEVSEVNKKLAGLYGDKARYIRQASFNNFDYHKTEYENGVKAEGTHEGYQQGMSLLVIGYEASISIKVENTRTKSSSTDPKLQGNVSFESRYSDWNPLYTITGITTTPSDPTGTGGNGEKTDLTITAGVQNEAGKEQIAMGRAEFQVQSLVPKLDEDGEETGEMVMGWITVSENQEEPTTVTFIGKEDTKYTYTIWAERVGDYQAVFHLDGVTVGEDLPDIRFEGQLGADIEHTHDYTAQVTVQGSGDNRALSSGNRNMASVSITTIVLAGTSLTKRVDHTLIEQNGEFTYSVSYTNNADEEMEQKLYLYDLMPYNGDIRDTDYTATTPETPTTPTDDLTVESVGGNVTSGAGNTTAYIYYSTITQSVLKSYVEFANGQEKPGGGQSEPRSDGEDINQMLRNALIGDDARGVYYIVKISEFEEAKRNGDFSTLKPVDIYTYDTGNTDIVTGVNTAIVEYNTGEPLGTVSIQEDVKNEYAFWNVRTNTLAQSGDKVETDLEGFDGELTLYKMFRWLGSIQPGKGDDLQAGTNVGGTNVENYLKYASCIYAVVEDLGAGATLTMRATLKTNANQASDIYGNIAHSWKQGDGRTGANLISNLVTTRVVGREISGLVWEDVDHDGSRNSVGGTPEPLIAGVTCTLFKWNGSEYTAVKAKEGANDGWISVAYQDENGKTVTKTFEEEGETKTVAWTTGADGAYRFMDLAAGNYVVAFSGDALKKYMAGATTWQADSVSASVNNDGAATSNLPGIDSSTYLYYIKYDEKPESGTNIKMHTLDELKADTTLMTNSIEVERHLDLGLIVDRYELPESGGRGTWPYRAIGLWLVSVALSGWWICRRKYRYGKLW